MVPLAESGADALEGFPSKTKTKFVLRHGFTRDWYGIYN